MQTLKKLPQIAPHNPASATAPVDVRNARLSSTGWQCYGGYAASSTLVHEERQSMLSSA
jgi:hypothetical protein